MNDLTTINDQTLVLAAKKGDNRAFEELIRRYEQKIHGLSLQMMGNEEEAGDILQETFLHAYRGLRNFHGKSSFSTWLYRIAMNNCLMKLRTRSQRNLVSLDYFSGNNHNDGKENQIQIPDWSTNPEINAEKEEIKRAINKALDTIPEDYRSVLILRDIEELDSKQVSNVLKISVPAMKSRLHRARTYLRDELNKYFSTHLSSRGGTR